MNSIIRIGILDKIVFVFLILLMIPISLAQLHIESDMDGLFMSEEDVTFFVRLRNPTEELFQGNLFVELIALERNRKLFDEQIFVYLRDSTLKIFRERLEEGDYKIRIELRDMSSDIVLDQKILEFSVVNVCNESVCNLKNADLKCDCRGEIGSYGGGICETHFECESNRCVNNQCVEVDFLQKFLNWVRGIF